MKYLGQSGLSGGGQKNYTVAGTYMFTMTTSCDWTLDITHKPPPTASSTTTTTAKATMGVSISTE